MGKFNFKRVKGERIYRKWAEWDIGDSVIGTLTDIGEDQYKKANYILEVIETTLEGVPEGKSLCLNSNGSLDYKMEDVPIGAVVRVQYTGTTVLEKGPFKGKEAHTVDVSIADGTDLKVDPSDLPKADEDEEDYGL